MTSGHWLVLCSWLPAPDRVHEVLLVRVRRTMIDLADTLYVIVEPCKASIAHPLA